MRLIDADDAVYELERVFPVEDYNKVVRAISRVPTIDAVHVVRCKDCKYFGGAFWCRWYECGTGGDGYCHHGERKDK